MLSLVCIPNKVSETSQNFHIHQGKLFSADQSIHLTWKKENVNKLNLHIPDLQEKLCAAYNASSLLALCPEHSRPSTSVYSRHLTPFSSIYIPFSERLSAQKASCEIWIYYFISLFLKKQILDIMLFYPFWLQSVYLAIVTIFLHNRRVISYLKELIRMPWYYLIWIWLYFCNSI